MYLCVCYSITIQKSSTVKFEWYQIKFKWTIIFYDWYILGNPKSNIVRIVKLIAKVMALQLQDDVSHAL